MAIDKFSGDLNWYGVRFRGANFAKINLSHPSTTTDNIRIPENNGRLHQPTWSTSQLNQRSIARFTQIEIMLNLIAHRNWCCKPVQSQIKLKPVQSKIVMLINAIGNKDIGNSNRRQPQSIYKLMRYQWTRASNLLRTLG